MSAERWVFIVDGESVEVTGPADDRGLIWWIEKVSQVEAAHDSSSEPDAVENESIHIKGERDSALGGVDLSKKEFDAFAAKDKQRRE